MSLHNFVSPLLVLFVASAASAADPSAKSDELKQLDRFVGTWKVEELVSKKAEWTPQEARTSGATATAKWILDGWCLEDRNEVTDGMGHLGIWHYDQAEKAIHYTMYQAPGGDRLDLTVRWNEKSQAFEGVGQMQGGVTMRTTVRFLDKNTKQWQATATDAAGKVYLDMTCKEVRTTVQPKVGGATSS